jgi:hypothetical protein
LRRAGNDLVLVVYLPEEKQLNAERKTKRGCELTNGKCLLAFAHDKNIRREGGRVS